MSESKPATIELEATASWTAPVYMTEVPPNHKDAIAAVHEPTGQVRDSPMDFQAPRCFVLYEAGYRFLAPILAPASKQQEPALTASANASHLLTLAQARLTMAQALEIEHQLPTNKAWLSLDAPPPTATRAFEETAGQAGVILGSLERTDPGLAEYARVAAGVKENAA